MVERRARVVPADRAGEIKLICLDTSPLDCLLHAGRIDHDSYAAAEHYAETWDDAGLRPSLASSYEHQTAFGTPACRFELMSPAQQQAWQAWGRARRAMPARAREAVDDLVLWWHRPERLDLVLAGLRALARHYGRKTPKA